MRLISSQFIMTVLILILLNSVAIASTPADLLRQLVESDMAGDPTTRLHLQTPEASVDEPLSRNPNPHSITFSLDADALELATNWRLQGSDNLCKNNCELYVVYHVVGTTINYGDPSWKDSTNGRQIVSYKYPFDRVVKYKFIRIKNDWKIKSFPPPYVDPQVVKVFFKNQIDFQQRHSLPAGLNQNAHLNSEIFEHWETTQLNILDAISK